MSFLAVLRRPLLFPNALRVAFATNASALTTNINTSNTILTTTTTTTTATTVNVNSLRKGISDSVRCVHTSSLSFAPSKRSNDNDVFETLRAMTQPPMARPQRDLSRKELDERARMVKKWSRYCQRKENHTMRALNLALKSQRKAHKRLQTLSPSLYEQAMVVDPAPIPPSLVFTQTMETPPIDDYTGMNE
eukprot:m.149544 g.149544  ORF g.149544 m.149544 type:complete len:191 (+) comp13271_c1_seq12:83-655(+)